MKIRTLRHLAGALLLVALASCGGGGGGGSKTLYVDFSVEPRYTYLWRDTSIELTTTGLEGNAPACETIAGTSFPAGLAFAPNSCRIVGTPTSTVGGSVNVRLRVPGFEGLAEKYVFFVVLGPPISYYYVGPVVWGSAQVQSPYSEGDVPSGTPNWASLPGEVLTYSIATGQLPPGLSLNPNTGTLSGVITGRPTTDFAVRVSAISSGRSYSRSSQSILYDVRDGFNFLYAGPPATVAVFYQKNVTYFYPFGKSAMDYTATNFRLAPTSNPLPPGLSLNPSNGSISGTPQVAGQTQVVVQMDLSTSGQTGVAETSASIFVF